MENLWTEYKREISSFWKLHKELSAFSNTEGGTLYIGVDDKSQFYKTPKQKISNIYQGLKSYSDNFLKTQINNIWKIEENFWKNNKKQKIYKITVQVSTEPIATYKRNTNTKKYYIRINNFIEETNFLSISKSKNELSSLSISFNDNNFQNLIRINSKFSKLYYRQSYKIVDKKDNVTILGNYFSDNPPTNIKSNIKIKKNIKITNLQIFFDKINEKFSSIQNYGIYRAPYNEIIKKIKLIARELILNAIAHGDINEEIDINFEEDIFSVENKWPSSVLANQFIFNLLKNKIFHQSFYPMRNRLLKDLKMIETTSRGYHEIITPKEDYWFILFKRNIKIKIMILPKITNDENKIKNMIERKKEESEVYLWT